MTPAKIWLDKEGKGVSKSHKARESDVLSATLVCKAHFSREKVVEGLQLPYRNELHRLFGLARKKVLPAVPPRSVLVLDRATYHTTLTDESKSAKNIFRKLQFAKWLIGHHVEWVGMKAKDEYTRLTRIELANIWKESKPKSVFLASVLVKKFDCEVLFLPMGHREFNPIETLWAYVKGYIARNNADFSLAEVERLGHKAIDEFDIEKWTKYARHCVEVENMNMAIADETPLDLGPSRE